MKPETAVRCIAALQAAWPHSELPDESFDLYAAGLKMLPISDEEAMAAIHTIIYTDRSQYMPSPGGVIARMIETVAPAPLFEVVWKEMCDHADKGDYFRPDDAPAMSPFAQALAQRVGWAVFRNADVLDPWFVRSCRHIYEAIATNYVTDVVRNPEMMGRPFVPTLPSARMLPDG